MHENMGSIYAIPIGKSVPPNLTTPNLAAAVIMHAGSFADHSINNAHAAERVVSSETPFRTLIAYLDFPVQPDRELAQIHREINRRPKKPLAIHPTTGRINLNTRSFIRNADPLPRQPESPVKIASGIRLAPVVDSLASKVAALEMDDMQRELHPGNSIVFVAQTRLSPSAHQSKKLRRASADGLSDRARQYIEDHHISDTDLDACANTLLSDGVISLIINGKPERFNLDSVYTLIKGTSKKKRDSFPQLHFFHALYSKFLDAVATRTMQESITAQDIIQHMHEQPELGIQIPHELNDRLAQETLLQHTGTTMPVEGMAAILKKVSPSVIAASPALQLYEVVVASAGYTLYSHDESPITSQDYHEEAGDYVATSSAWPDMVVGAVNKGSATWNTMLAFEREYVSKRNPHVDDAFVQDHLEKRLQKLFSGHVLNFHSMKSVDVQILHAFLAGLALDIPETQLVLYERKAKLMVEEGNSSLAPHSLFDDSVTGSIPTQRRLFKDGMTIEEKNVALPGIRDSAFAVTQIVQLYENLRQLSLLSDQPHPHLDWRNAISLRGAIIHIPLFSQHAKHSYHYVPGNTYGIEMVDHSSFITNNDIAQVRAQVGRTLAERMAARRKKEKTAKKTPNATPLRLVA